MSIALHILSPEGTLGKADVEAVTLPGVVSRFMVLKNHAPLVSALEAGDIVYRTADGKEESLSIREGFVQVRNNEVNVCVEV